MTFRFAPASLDHILMSWRGNDSDIGGMIEHEVNGKLPFLDLCVNVMDDEGTKITMYKAHRTSWRGYLNLI